MNCERVLRTCGPANVASEFWFLCRTLVQMPHCATWQLTNSWSGLKKKESLYHMKELVLAHTHTSYGTIDPCARSCADAKCRESAFREKVKCNYPRPRYLTGGSPWGNISIKPRKQLLVFFPRPGKRIESSDRGNIAQQNGLRGIETKNNRQRTWKTFPGACNLQFLININHVKSTINAISIVRY